MGIEAKVTVMVRIQEPTCRRIGKSRELTLPSDVPAGLTELLVEVDERARSGSSRPSRRTARVDPDRPSDPKLAREFDAFRTCSSTDLLKTTPRPVCRHPRRTRSSAMGPDKSRVAEAGLSPDAAIEPIYVASVTEQPQPIVRFRLCFRERPGDIAHDRRIPLRCRHQSAGTIRLASRIGQPAGLVPTEALPSPSRHGR